MASELDRPLLPPEKIWSNAYPNEEQLRKLGREMLEARVPEDVRLLFAKLAIMPPAARLAVNLKVLVGRMVRKPIYHVFKDGLSPTEHAALVALDMRGLSLRSRETAHGLLNVHERWCAIKSLRRLFSQALESGGAHLEVPKEEE
jgi:hypothetical protein